MCNWCVDDFGWTPDLRGRRTGRLGWMAGVILVDLDDDFGWTPDLRDR
ncbi:MAG: hypothetical protein GY703_01615 [Gammaproteobacteria bacterium]|nr:hypothetical protein [Gammaproteobacteria bacterium]